MFQTAISLLDRQPKEIAGSNIVLPTGSGLSAQWKTQQEGSISRYESESYEADRTISMLFGGFIATTLDKQYPVLDVGCGLFRELPSYVSDMGLRSYIGMEPLEVIVERDYPCLVGSVAEDIPLKDGSIGAAIFATSLDHIEKPEVAINEVLRVLRPGGSLYFWNGLYDPHILAEQKTFGNILNHSRGLKRALRVLVPQIEYAVLLRRMWNRKRDLAAGRPLDHAHYRYFTQAKIQADMESYGLRIVRQVLVPGSNSHFSECKPIKRVASR
ncbi:class I SAM-dependent methyltransferase [Rhizorhabdus histidinilytica]|uniref:Methyltransferase domain-containing protein n=1 Tax=Rhizorhabdus histidinilytica TaxID=439228 RepID=A0A1T5A8A9_9SPHN|nr:class I SAM-dependent methyltransferase [Rhizorhabdus histidinilytica]SKB31262.1 Methyltransferase domain-containing protein [Rhizorhabdus histidinilytica]